MRAGQLPRHRAGGVRGERLVAHAPSSLSALLLVVGVGVVVVGGGGGGGGVIRAKRVSNCYIPPKKL